MKCGYIQYEDTEPTHREIQDSYPALFAALDKGAEDKGVSVWFEFLTLLSRERDKARKGLLEGIKTAMDESLKKESRR